MPRPLRDSSQETRSGWQEGKGAASVGQAVTMGQGPSLRACHYASSLPPQIYLSWKSGPGEVKHWKDMIARPRQPVAQWHQLKA